MNLIMPLVRCKRVFFLPSFRSRRMPMFVPTNSARSPSADLPTTSAFLGGLVAQEAIKMITKQYVPVNGYCVVDLVETWTGVIA